MAAQTQFIGVHVGQPNSAELFKAIVVDDVGWKASGILAVLLQLRLHQSGLGRDPNDQGVGVMGPLHDCIMIFEVTDQEEALKVLKRQIESLVLPPSVQIGVPCAGGWRCLHPGEHVQMNYLMDIERHEGGPEKIAARQREFISRYCRSADRGLAADGKACHAADLQKGGN